MNDFNKIKKVYFLGIGGIGVSAIASMFIHEGKEVSGSDTADSEIVEELRKVGAKINIGQDLNYLPDDLDSVIYTIAIEKFAPEFLEVVRQKFGPEKVLSYPESLGIISKDKYTIAISGTHGKTTTTAMIAKIMIDAGLDPTVIVGSLLSDFKTNFIAGKSKYLVVEACEYCRSFLQINPTVVAITTIDADHMDYYKDSNDIENAFGEFLDKAKEVVVGNFDDEKVKHVIDNFQLRIRNDELGMTNDEKKPKILNSNAHFDNNLKLKIPGEHNRKNASVALAVAEFLSIDKNSATASLESFSGTWRRFEYKGKTKGGAIVYDDYAHHPIEIAATLSGARELYPDKKITIVFEPHLYSRTKSFFDDFVLSLSKADYIILLPIYFAREEKDSSVSSDLLAVKIAEQNDNVLSLETYDEASKEILESAGPDDVVIIMGAGPISKLSQMIV